MLTRPRRAAKRGRVVRTSYRPDTRSRMDRRREERKRRVRIGGAGGALTLTLLLVVIAVVVTSAVRKDDPAGPAPRTQTTVLMSLRAADGSAASTALFAYDPVPRAGSIAFVPPTVLAQVPGVGRVPFERALKLGGAKAAQDALTDLLGVTVDHDWTLSRDGFVSLVDRVGGVEVDVETDVVQPSGGRSVIAIQAGRQHFDGARAYLYATYTASGEDPLASLPRLQRVLEAVFGTLPDEDGMRAVLASLGTEVTSSMPADRLARFLTGLAEMDDVAVATLPVAPLDAGGPRQLYTLDEVQALELVRSTLAASVPPGRFEGDNRVILLNGAGTPGITTTAQQRLSRQGFDIVRVGNANRFDFASSAVLVKDATAASQELGERVARLLGLPVSAVAVYPRENTVSDVIVVLGKDYKP